MLCIGCRSCLRMQGGVGRNWSDSFFFIWEGKSCVTFTKSSITWTMGCKTSFYTSCFISFFFFPQPIHIHFYWPEVKGKTLFTSRDENQFLLFIHLLFVPLPIHSFLKCTLSISNPLSVGFQMKTCTATCTAPYQPVSNKTLSISVKIFWN